MVHAGATRTGMPETRTCAHRNYLHVLEILESSCFSGIAADQAVSSSCRHVLPVLL